MAVRLTAAHRAGAVRTAEADAGLTGLGAFQVTFSGLALAASWLTPAVAIAWLVGLAAAAGAFAARGAGGGYRTVASRADTLLLIAAGPLVLGAYVLAGFTPPTARPTTGLAARGR